MDINIIELKEEHLEQYKVEEFLFRLIKESFGLDYVPEFHYDVKGLKEYYIIPSKNNFYIAIKDDKIIGSAGIREYDKNYNIKGKTYDKDKTASLYRIYVDSEHRHNGIATQMIKKIEEFCKKQKYHEIYLHTQKDSYGALDFWLSQNYQITEETNDEYGTIHMEKTLL